MEGLLLNYLLANGLILLAACVALWTASRAVVFWLPSTVAATNVLPVPKTRAQQSAKRHWGLPVLITLGACVCVIGVFYIVHLIESEWFDWFMQILFTASLALLVLFRIRRWQQRTAVLLIIGVGLAAWLLASNWLTASLFALVMAVIVLVLYQLRSAFMIVALVTTIAAFCYDALLVYGTTWMAERAAQVVETSSPRAVVAPAVVDSADQNIITLTDQWTAPPVALLGLGDVILPGLLIVLAARLAYRLARPMIYWAAMGGFVFGFCVCVGVALATDSGQPALIYLVPGVATGVYLAARKYGLQGSLHDRLSDVHCSKTEPQS